jgi:hypothetical protein
MTVLVRGKARPGIATTSQVNAVTPAAHETGSLLYDQTIDKFKYWDGDEWKPLPGGWTPSYGEVELANDVTFVTADGTVGLMTLEINESGLFLVQAEAYFHFSADSTSAAQTTDIQLRDSSLSGTVLGKTWVSQKRGGDYIVHATVQGFINNPTDVIVSTTTLSDQTVIVKSYANHGTIAHWLRIG